MSERDYRKEYDSFHGTEEQKKRRAERNAARNKAAKDGKVHKGDGKEVGHVSAPRTGSLANVKTRVMSKAENRKDQPKRG